MGQSVTDRITARTTAFVIVGIEAFRFGAVAHEILQRLSTARTRLLDIFTARGFFALGADAAQSGGVLILRFLIFLIICHEKHFSERSLSVHRNLLNRRWKNTFRLALML